VDPLRVAGREENAHVSTFGVTKQEGVLRPNCVHHSPEVVHADLQGGEMFQGDGIGEPGAALVKDHQSGERCEPVEESGESRVLPHQLDVGNESRNIDQIY
jgi:hypothetical protein